MSDYDNLQELFALPINNKLVAKVDGIDLYSNDKLKDKYINVLSKRKETKNVSNKLSDLVTNGKVVPCWLNKGIFSLSFYKILAPSPIKGVLGFYYPEKNKFFIIIDNNITLGFASNTFLARLTMHELAHMVAHTKKSSFIKMVEKDLEMWYYHYLVELFDLDVNKMKKFSSMELVNFLFRNTELKSNFSSSVFKKYSQIVKRLCEPYTKQNKNEFEKNLHDLSFVAYIFVTDQDKFFSNLGNYKHILKPAYKAYEHSFGLRNLNTLCIQELIYPSEVISVKSETKPDSKIYAAISKL